MNKSKVAGDRNHSSAQEKSMIVRSNDEEAKLHNHSSEDDFHSATTIIEHKIKATEANYEANNKDHLLPFQSDAKQDSKFGPESKLIGDSDNNNDYHGIGWNQTRNLPLPQPPLVSSSFHNRSRHSASSTFLTSPAHLSSSEEDSDDNRQDEHDEDSLVDSTAGTNSGSGGGSDDDEDDRAFEALKREFNDQFSD